MKHMEADKAKWRQSLKARFRDFDPELARCESARLVSWLDAWLAAWHPRAVLAGFVPRADEPAILPVLAGALVRGREVILPRVVPGSGGLEWRRWDGQDNFEPAAGGLKLAQALPDWPLLDPVGRSLIVLVPGLGFDTRGGRLGRGGGFYDRFLDRMARETLSLTTVGVAFSWQMVEQLPLDSRDFRMDMMACVTCPDPAFLREGSDYSTPPRS